jgi:hypothetical protein
MLYDTRLYVKEDKKIRTVVVCKEGNNKVERIEGGVFSYEVEIKALNKYSADEFFKKEKVSEVELIFTPLMNSKYSISERIRKSIEKYKEQEKEQSKIIDFAAAILVLSNRIITREEFNEIWEEIKMLNIMRYAEEIGIEKGIEKDRVIMAERLIKKNMTFEEVAELTELSIEKIIEIAIKRVV